VAILLPGVTHTDASSCVQKEECKGEAELLSINASSRLQKALSRGKVEALAAAEAPAVAQQDTAKKGVAGQPAQAQATKKKDRSKEESTSDGIDCVLFLLVTLILIGGLGSGTAQ
jgi:ribosomal protein L12E/L44/L45/RPP1/RPP2